MYIWGKLQPEPGGSLFLPKPLTTQNYTRCLKLFIQIRIHSVVTF